VIFSMSIIMPFIITLSLSMVWMLSLAEKMFEPPRFEPPMVFFLEPRFLIADEVAVFLVDFFEVSPSADPLPP